MQAGTVVNDTITLGSGTLNLIAGHDMTISANITAGMDFEPRMILQ